MRRYGALCGVFWRYLILCVLMRRHVRYVGSCADMWRYVAERGVMRSYVALCDVIVAL